MTKQPSLETTLLAPHGRRPKKGGLNKAHLLHPQLANSVQQASFYAVKQQERKGTHPSAME